MRLTFRVFGYAILVLGTRLVRDWYAIKVLIISSVTRFRDFSLYLKGWQEKKQKKYIMGGVGKASKWCNRVPKVFVGFLALGVFVGFLADFWRGVFVGFLADLGQKWSKIGCFDNGCLCNYVVSY